MKKFLLLFVTFLAVTECLLIPKIGPSERTRQYLRQRVNNRGRILGGTPAEIEHFPHMLVLLDITFGGFICGASAIHTLWAVTAAHCLEFGTPASEINLRGGTSNRLSGGFIFFVESYTLHPQYDPFMLDFDVAIIQVQRDTPLQGNNVVPIPISPTCIHSCCEACEPENVNITGWGWDSTSFPIMLQQVSLPIYNQARCDAIWGGIGDHFFCVTSKIGVDSCNGDSGSPLVRIIDGKQTQLGVVSFGSINCGDGSGPSVNTRLEYPSIRNWIVEVTNGDV